MRNIKIRKVSVRAKPYHPFYIFFEFSTDCGIGVCHRVIVAKRQEWPQFQQILAPGAALIVHLVGKDDGILAVNKKHALFESSVTRLKLENRKRIRLAALEVAIPCWIGRRLGTDWCSVQSVRH